MIENGSNNFSKLKPVGIVVTSGSQPTKEILHPCMRVVDLDLTAVEKSIYECALAGCSSVWICCDETFQPIIKNRIGDYIKDPVSLSKASFTKYPSENTVDIPIYYYLVHPKDRDKRSGRCWDVFTTAMAVYYISRRVSRWSIPSHYYISFCNGLYDFGQLRSHRRDLLSPSGIAFEHMGKTGLGGLDLGFSITGDSIRDSIASLKREKKYHNSEDLSFLDLGGVFNLKRHKKIQVDEYFTCYEWQNYVEYIKNRRFDFNIKTEAFFNLRSKGIINE